MIYASGHNLVGIPILDGLIGQSGAPEAHFVDVSMILGAPSTTSARGANLQSGAPPAVANHRATVWRRGEVRPVRAVEVDLHLIGCRGRVHRHGDVRPHAGGHRGVAERRRRAVGLEVADGVRRLCFAGTRATSRASGSEEHAPSAGSELRDVLKRGRVRGGGHDPRLERELRRRHRGSGEGDCRVRRLPAVEENRGGQ